KSQADGTPYMNVTQSQAITAAAEACAGCKLISEAQWLTVAHNLAGVAGNWSGGSVGSGYLFRGHTDNSPSAVLAAGTDDTDGYFGTGNTTGEQRRTLRLNSGGVIWDFAGNISEWTSGTVSGAGNQPGAPGAAFREWNAVP